MFIKRIFRSLLLLCLTLPLTAQSNFIWWNQIHNWDGVTSWHHYLTLSPAFMGPNALPVPEIQNGSLPENTTLNLSYEGHFSEGDNTQNLFTNLFIPIAKNRIGLNFSMVPFEHYSLDTLTRDLRAVRDRDGKGWSTGDLYIGTFVQLVKDHEHLPDLLLTINIKTATGGNLPAARFTDTPGYYFDLSMGKSFKLEGSPLREIRPHASVGFFAWQTFRLDYYQNDAFLYSVGCNFDFNKIRFTPAFGGYNGYIGEGDKPMVVRASLGSRFEKTLNYKLMFQQGLRDFPYTSVRAGLEIVLMK